MVTSNLGLGKSSSVKGLLNYSIPGYGRQISSIVWFEKCFVSTMWQCVSVVLQFVCVCFVASVL